MTFKAKMMVYLESILSGDAAGVTLVYLYVGSLLIISRICFKKKPFLGRKFLHFMTGNIIFFLPLFETKWVMVLIAAFPFVLITFLMSSRSPLDVSSPLTRRGHDFGLFYYAIAWTLLALIFFERLEIIAIGIAAMSYGDGTAGFIGSKFGKHRFSIGSATKSLEGSIAMFAVTSLSIPLILIYFGSNAPPWYTITMIASLATAIEAIIGKGYDNLSIALGTALIYYITVH